VLASSCWPARWRRSITWSGWPRGAFRIWPDRPTVGPMLPHPARLCRARRSARPAHPRKTAASRGNSPSYVASRGLTTAGSGRRSIATTRHTLSPMSAAVPMMWAALIKAWNRISALLKAQISSND
jgi:hypothetical protein